MGEWMNDWVRNHTGRKVYNHMNTINTKDNIKLMNRKHQIIFRLRTQNITLNQHLNRINPEMLPLCPLCSHYEENVEHFLLTCPKLQDLRKQYLPPIPTLGNTLYTSLDQLEKTSTFTNMAMSRRAKAQRLLDY